MILSRRFKIKKNSIINIVKKKMESTMKSNSSKAIGVKNNEMILNCMTDSSTFLSTLPRGAYTTARTTEQNYIFNWREHMNRLIKTMTSMKEYDRISDKINNNGDDIEKNIIKTVNIAMKLYKCNDSYSLNNEFKVTILVAPIEENSDLEEDKNQLLDIYCHLSLLKQPNKPCVKIKLLPGQRNNALAKDSEWIKERKSLVDKEMKNDPDINDIILYNINNELLEGTQSNFFLIKNNIIYTANKDILEGTVRKIILEICNYKNIPIVLNAPTIYDIINSTENSKNIEVFITSTSRLLLPVNEVIYYNNKLNKDETIQLTYSHPFIKLLQDEITYQIKKHSVRIFE